MCQLQATTWALEPSWFLVPGPSNSAGFPTTVGTDTGSKGNETDVLGSEWEDKNE